MKECQDETQYISYPDRYETEDLRHHFVMMRNSIPRVPRPDGTPLPTSSLETEQTPKRFDSGDRRANKARESLEEVRKSANLSFKERLKQRFQKFREEHGSVLDREPSNSRGTGGFGRAIGQGRDRDREAENIVSFGKKSDIIRNKLHQVLNQPAKVRIHCLLR